MRLDDFIEFNPKRPIKKGIEAPFVEMAAIPQENRDIAYIHKKLFNGSGSKFQNGDTLFARITPCLENGKTAKVNCLNQNEIAHGSTEFIVMAAKEPEYDKDFVYYLCRWNKFREFAKSRMEGTSGRQRVDWKALAESEWELPPKEVRKEIGFILKQIDDKIANNNRINQTLEEMTQALFKSWFVDFEPVKAKMEAIAQGTDPQIAAMEIISGKTAEETQNFADVKYDELRTTADLFSDSLVVSELGLIPEGWSVKPLSKIANYQNGLALQKFRPKNENDYLPVVKIAQLKKGVADSEEKAASDIKPECIINNGDVVFSWSGSLMVDIWCGGKGALNQHLFKVTSDQYPRWFYYYSTKLHLENFQRIAADKAVTMGHIKREHLDQALCTTPKNDILTGCGKIIGDIVNKQIKLRIQNMSIIELRDTLLPKLLSGEIELNAD